MAPGANDDLLPLVDATAGATGALLTACMLSPVDIAKTRMQTGSSKDGVVATIRHLVEVDGVAGLFTGLHLKGVEVVLRNFLYFYAYEYLKATMYRLGFKPSALGHTACGVVAGVANLTVTMPIDTLNVRIQSGDHGSPAAAARNLLAEGVEGMWRGFGVSSVLTLNPALTFALFDSLKARTLVLLGGDAASLSAAQAFVLGSVAKTVATLLTYPLMRAKSVLQAAPAIPAAADGADGKPHANGNGSGGKAAQAPALAPAARRRQRQGILRVLLDIVEQEGVGGLYAGCAAQIFTAVTKSGILLTTKEQLAAFAMRLVLVLQRGRRQRLAA